MTALAPSSFIGKDLQQRERSREAGRSVFVADGTDGQELSGEHSEFVGYERLATPARDVAVREAPEERVDLYLDVTPFYGESGGQVGDTGATRETRSRSDSRYSHLPSGLHAGL